jgi:hypothetical protein
MDGWTPPLRIREADGRVRLGLEGFGDVEGATLQEAADELVAYLLRVAFAVRAEGVGSVCSECSLDVAQLEFLWKLGDVVAAGRDPREVLFGSNPLAAWPSGATASGSRSSNSRQSMGKETRLRTRSPCNEQGELVGGIQSRLAVADVWTPWKNRCACRGPVMRGRQVLPLARPLRGGAATMSKPFRGTTNIEIRDSAPDSEPQQRARDDEARVATG